MNNLLESLCLNEGVWSEQLINEVRDFIDDSNRDISVSCLSDLLHKLDQDRNLLRAYSLNSGQASYEYEVKDRNWHSIKALIVELQL